MNRFSYILKNYVYRDRQQNLASFTQNSLHVIYRKTFTTTDTCIPMHVYSKVHKQKDTQEYIRRPELF